MRIKPFAASFVAKMLRLSSVKSKHGQDLAPSFTEWGQLVCRHELTASELSTDGVTLGWDATPAVRLVWTSRCAKCGATFTHSGILPRAACIFKRDANDWPLNGDGSRMRNHHSGKENR